MVASYLFAENVADISDNGDLFELLPGRVTQALNILDVLQLKKS